MIPLITGLQLLLRHPVHISRMYARVGLMHYCNRSDALERLIDLLSKISQIIGANVPDN
jgi:hypothetical protein